MDITQYPIVTRVTTLSLLLGTLSGCDLFNKDDEAEAPEAGFSVNKTSGTAPVTVHLPILLRTAARIFISGCGSLVTVTPAVCKTLSMTTPSRAPIP